MLPEQKHIYYLAGPSRDLCENSPYYEAIRQKGYEVLFVYESHDEVLLMQLAEFDKKKLKSVESELETDTKKDDTILEGGKIDYHTKQMIYNMFSNLILFIITYYFYPCIFR